MNDENASMAAVNRDKDTQLQALMDRGNVLIRERRAEQALSVFSEYLSHKPDSAAAYTNIGAALNLLGRFEDGIANLRRALEINPHVHVATWNLGIAMLALGRYNEGWPNYEVRTSKIIPQPTLPFPAWRGESLRGKSFMLCPEQGHGDYIQFVRYSALLKDLGVSHLTIACHEALRDLLGTAAGVDEVVTKNDQLRLHDYWLFPMSLPLHFRTTLDTIPAGIPYLHSRQDRREYWHQRLPEGELKIGLVWKGKPDHTNDVRRSLPNLSALAPLWQVPGISFVSLQKGAGEDEAVASQLPLTHLGGDLRDFADTAAIVEQLDLVICVDTAIAHVAGALGKPCWVILPAIGSDWRWLRDRSDSPWYPRTHRLFRQQRSGEWGDVICDIVGELRKISARAQHSSLTHQ